MSNKIFKQAANRERGEEKAQSVEKNWIITLFLGKGGVWYYVSPHMCRKVTLMLTFQGGVTCPFSPSFCAFGCMCGSLCGSLCVSVNQAASCPPHDCVLCLTAAAGWNRPQGLSLLWRRSQMGHSAELLNCQPPARAAPSCLFQSFTCLTSHLVGCSFGLSVSQVCGVCVFSIRLQQFVTVFQIERQDKIRVRWGGIRWWVVNKIGFGR